MSATPTFYILHGDDSISRDAALARMRKAMGEDGDLNRSEFDGTQTSAAEVLAAVKSLPFLAEKRLVIVHGLLARLTRRNQSREGAQDRSLAKLELDRLVEELPKLPAFARLVFYETEVLNESNKLIKAARKMDNGLDLGYSAPSDFRSWLAERAQLYDADISPRAASAISDMLNYDEHSRNARSKNATRRREGMLGRALAIPAADNELAKLADYVAGERPISEEDVAVLTPYVPEANIFAFVDALVNGHGDRACQLMTQYFHDNSGDQNGFRLFAMFVGQIRRLLMARDYLDRGGASGKEMANALNVHGFVAGKLATQARRFNSAQLDAILKRLQRYDQDMKTGRIEPRLALELLVTSLARA